MPPVIRNRRQPWELTEDDVAAAIARIGERDEDRALEAGHVYNTLTWDEGPGQIRRAGVQDWLWYQLPTKYITDEAGYMGRLAETAAILFDELGLDAYAAVCRDERTGAVHAAFGRSDTEGFRAMRKAREASGIEPPDLDDFAWGQTMGMEEACAHATIENVLELAVDGAREKVTGRISLEGRACTPAMLDTPRRRFERRARYGHWSSFSSNPMPFFEKFRPTVERSDFVTKGKTFAIASRLEKRLGNLDGPRRTLPDRLALYRAFHTAGLELADAADDSYGTIGEVRTTAWRTYLTIDWRAAGMHSAAYWQDLCLALTGVDLADDSDTNG